MTTTKIDTESPRVPTAEQADSPRTLAETAYLALYAGRVDEARALFENLDRLAPLDVLPKLGRAECALAVFDAEAARSLARAAARCPSCDRSSLLFAYWLEAKAAMQLGDAALVRELAERMLDLDPAGPWSASMRTLLENY